MVGATPPPVAASTKALVRAGRNNAPVRRALATHRGEERRPAGLPNYLIPL
jgi:hypothetical protein